MSWHSTDSTGERLRKLYCQAANPNDHVFEVTADYVNISGFAVENATGKGKAGLTDGLVENNTVFNNKYGIRLRASHNNTVSGNTDHSNKYGISLYSSSNNNISCNWVPAEYWFARVTRI